MTSSVIGLVSTKKLLLNIAAACQSHQSSGVKVATPHCIAAEEGHISILIQLMLSLPDLCADDNDEGQNVLHIAAAKNNKDMVKCILA